MPNKKKRIVSQKDKLLMRQLMKEGLTPSEVGDKLAPKKKASKPVDIDKTSGDPNLPPISKYGYARKKAFGGYSYETGHEDETTAAQVQQGNTKSQLGKVADTVNQGVAIASSIRGGLGGGGGAGGAGGALSKVGGMFGGKGGNAVSQGAMAEGVSATQGINANAGGGAGLPIGDMGAAVGNIAKYGYRRKKSRRKRTK